MSSHQPPPDQPDDARGPDMPPAPDADDRWGAPANSGQAPGPGGQGPPDWSSPPPSQGWPAQPPPPPGQPGWAAPPGQPAWGAQAPPGAQADWHRPPPGADDGFFETAVGVITSPAATFRAIAYRQPVAWTIVLVLAINALTGVVQGLTFGATADPLGAPPSPGMDGGVPAGIAVVGGVMVGAPLGLAFLAVWTAVVLLFAKMLRGAGTYRATFCGLGFAYVPTMFAVIVTALTVPLGPAATILSTLVAFATGVWTIVLSVFAVREAHRFSTGRAVGAVLLPVAALFILGFLVVIAIIGAVMTALA